MVTHEEEWGEDILAVSRAQWEAGPHAFAEGLLVKGWEDLQAAHIQATESKRDPSRWITELIKKLWNVSWDMWDSRNGEVHKNKNTRKAQIIAQLDADVRNKHFEGQTNRFLPRMEREFFQAPVEDILEFTEYQKRAWLHIARRYVERDRQRVARNRSVRIMREWLQPGSTGHIGRNRRRIINRSESDLRAPEGSRRGPGRHTA